jgi:hypothetical protein
MKLFKSLVVAAVVLLSASMFTGCMMMSPVRTVSTGSYENPQWAPPYYSGARYYYLPDLELYYDLGTREYIYLMDGQWNFSPYLPTMYRDYDLSNGFCVVLDVNVYKPWLHYQYYTSHYPRFYYRDYYDHSNIPYVRAYNENIRSAVYWNQNERQRARPYDDVNLRDNRRFKYSKDDKKEQKNWTNPNQGSGAFGGAVRGEQQNTDNQNNNTARPAIQNQPENQTSTRTTTTTRTNTDPKEEKKTSTTNTRQTTNVETPAVRNNRTNYFGRTIGNSVKVTREMKDNTPAPVRTTTTTTTRTTRGATQTR